MSRIHLRDTSLRALVNADQKPREGPEPLMRKLTLLHRELGSVAVDDFISGAK